VINPRGYGEVSKYWKFVKNNGQLVKFPKVGRFYCYQYKFATDYPYDELRFYDLLPFSFVFEANDATFTALNLHHLPLESRRVWFHRLQQVSQAADSVIPYLDFEDGRNKIIRNVQWPLVCRILKKSKIGVRQYRYERVGNLRLMPIAIYPELYKFWANSYFNATIKDIQARYNQFRPK